MNGSMKSSAVKSFRVVRSQTRYHLVYGRKWIGVSTKGVGVAAADNELEALLNSDEAGDGSGAPAKSTKSADDLYQIRSRTVELIEAM